MLTRNTVFDCPPRVICVSLHVNLKYCVLWSEFRLYVIVLVLAARSGLAVKNSRGRLGQWLARGHCKWRGQKAYLILLQRDRETKWTTSGSNDEWAALLRHHRLAAGPLFLGACFGLATSCPPEPSGPQRDSWFRGGFSAYGLPRSFKSPRTVGRSASSVRPHQQCRSP